MGLYPYLLVLEATLAANGTGTLSYPVPQNEQLELHQIFQQSTGAFGITSIHDSGGTNFTNASSTIEIDDDFIDDVDEANIAVRDFIVPLVVNGGTILYIDVEDTSGAGNTVSILLNGVRKTGSNINA